jgi:hypothetical protein
MKIVFDSDNSWSEIMAKTSKCVPNGSLAWDHVNVSTFRALREIQLFNGWTIMNCIRRDLV